MADVAGFYRAFGLFVSESAHERADHISLETEFMAVLLTRELHALQENLGQELVDVCRDAQRKFFRDHLGWWLPAFGTNLMRNTNGFYSVLGKLICAFVPAERAILQIDPLESVPIPLSIPAQPMACRD